VHQIVDALIIIQTFSEKKTSKTVSQLEKDKTLLLSAMKLQMAYSQRTRQPIKTCQKS
jgi:hypothetical protein